jgi:hypothetical protein
MLSGGLISNGVPLADGYIHGRWTPNGGFGTYLPLKDADSRGQSGLEDYASKTFMSRHTGDDDVQIELSYVT